jgi:hypothetical protein
MDVMEAREELEEASTEEDVEKGNELILHYVYRTNTGNDGWSCCGLWSESTRFDQSKDACYRVTVPQESREGSKRMATRKESRSYSLGGEIKRRNNAGRAYIYYIYIYHTILLWH